MTCAISESDNASGRDMTAGLFFGYNGASVILVLHHHWAPFRMLAGAFLFHPIKARTSTTLSCCLQQARGTVVPVRCGSPRTAQTNTSHTSFIAAAASGRVQFRQWTTA